MSPHRSKLFGSHHDIKNILTHTNTPARTHTHSARAHAFSFLLTEGNLCDVCHDCAIKPIVNGTDALCHWDTQHTPSRSN